MPLRRPEGANEGRDGSPTKKPRLWLDIRVRANAPNVE